MENKPKCKFGSCTNNAELSKRFLNKDYFRKFCTSHKRKFYGMEAKIKLKRKESLRRNRAKFRAMKKGICSQCGWIGPCDIHRLVAGYKGGRYVEGNVIEICPNCHRLEHRGLIKLTSQI